MNIRNFSIIAHVNHGKSTLSDCLIQICGGLSKREMFYQVLDSMDLERERGITIKARNVTLKYISFSNDFYYFNFIDTPGHVDFFYEVTRSLSACEGVILLIDITQGIEAQTLANFKLAVFMKLKIILVLNKIDLFKTNINNLLEEIKNIFNIDINSIIYISSKTGYGILNLLNNIIKFIPSPLGKINNCLQALILDSWFDKYFGVLSLICVKNGFLCKGDKIKVMSSGKSYFINKLGIFTPKSISLDILKCGFIGWIICGVKTINSMLVGDTITNFYNPSNKLLPGFKKVKPLVYANFFPLNSNDYKLLFNSFNRLSLNDSSLFYEADFSPFLGCGFRCGFLGLLHLEIIKERLYREYNIKVLVTNPRVIYEVLTKKNGILYVDNSFKLPSLNNIIELREPISECRILIPKIYLGDVIVLCNKKRGIQVSINFYCDQVILVYFIPMSEVIFDFFNSLKSITNGYSSLDYRFKYYKCSDIVKLDFLINKERFDILSLILHRNNIFSVSYNFVNKLKKIVPRCQFDIVIQSVIGKKVVYSTVIKQLRKNVIEKCYGGDITRKKKLLYNQKLGKKKIKKFGKINLSKDIFLSLFFL